MIWSSVLLTWSTWMFSVSATWWMEKSVLCGKILLTVLGHVPLPRLVCVHIKPGVLDLIRVIENVISTCHCMLHAFGKCSSSEWVVMVCLGTLAHGEVSLIMKEHA
jgi:hypothetical protein